MRADFVANASHELRTPLASLLGFIETLQGPAREDPEARERFLEIMRGQALRMSRLIEDLLSLSDRKSTRLNSSHANISYAVFCLQKHTQHTARPSRLEGRARPLTVPRSGRSSPRSASAPPQGESGRGAPRRSPRAALRHRCAPAT